MFFLSQLFHRSNIVFALLVAASIGTLFLRPQLHVAADSFFGVGADSRRLDNVVAVVVRQPDLSDIDQRVTVRIEDEEYFVRVTTGVAIDVRAGDIVTLKCTAKRPLKREGETFDYGLYLLRHHTVGTCNAFDLPVIGHRDSFGSRIIDLKLWLEARLLQVLTQPFAGLVLGIVFGENRAIPEALSDAFRITGTTHLLVISGSNISMIIGWMNAVFGRLFSRRVTIVLIYISIAIYVFMTGLQSSAMRAAVFGSCVLLSQVLGRPTAALRALLLTACIMTLWTPLVTMIDIGFQLSFLASLGMILFAEGIEKRLWWLPATAGVRAGSAATVAATLFTTPLIASQFQVVSLISPFANLILVPMLNICLPFGIAIVATAAISPLLGMLFAIPFALFSAWIITIVEWAAAIPYAQVTLTALPATASSLWYSGCCGYACLILFKSVLRPKTLAKST